MLRVSVVSLLLSCVAAEVPLMNANADVSFRELQKSESEGKSKYEHFSGGPMDIWMGAFMIKDSDMHPELVNNSKIRTVEILQNQGEGAGYMGKIWVGDQELMAIWDTGSDQQVVNSVKTLNMLKPCPFIQGHCYNAMKSPKYHRLSMVPRKVSYGSGDTFVSLGTDTISNKAATVDNHPFYELLTTNIPNILTHEIDVVAGLGPRGWTGVTLSKEMQVDRLSFCFPADNTKDGYLIWNDSPVPGHFNTMPVLGDHPTYWGLKTDGMALVSSQGSVPLAFKGEMIVDSGTSLITLDKDTLKQVEEHLTTFEKNAPFECNDKTLNQYPDLTFKLNGIPHRFQPKDYMMYTEAEDDFPELLKPWLKMDPACLMNLPACLMSTPGNGTAMKKKCVLMFTPPMENNMGILGMPFLRNYYTVFDRSTKSVSTALHDGNCNMKKDGEPMSLRQKVREHQTLRRIDITKLQFSQAFRTLYDKHQKAEEAAKKAAEAVGISTEPKGTLLLREKMQ